MSTCVVGQNKIASVSVSDARFWKMLQSLYRIAMWTGDEFVVVDTLWLQDLLVQAPVGHGVGRIVSVAVSPPTVHASVAPDLPDDA